MQLSSDYQTAESLLPEMEKIFTSILEGKNKLHITKDGFLSDDSSEEARTWMDAIVDGKAVTDRSGCAVEIQALWYNSVYYTHLDVYKRQQFDSTKSKK